MSGPKSFSVHVFDSKLKEIFSLQSQISRIVKELQNFSLDDNELNISFDCSDYINKNLNEINKQLNSFELGKKRTVKQAEHDRIQSRIESKISSLHKTLKSIKKEKQEFLNKRQDYLSYISYDNYFENSMQSFDQFKVNLTGFLEKNIKKESPELFEKSKSQINQIAPDIKKLTFKFGFQKIEEKSKQKVNEHINRKEEKASEVRNKIVRKMLAESIAQKKTNIPSIEKEDSDLSALKAKIQDEIDFIENDKERKRFKNELIKLNKSEVLTGIYFYKEFLDNLNKSVHSQSFRRKIKNLVYELNSIETAGSLMKKKNELLQYAVELLASETIKKYKYDDFEAQCYFLKEENKGILENEFVKQKENEYLKTRLINGLQNMNYQVMDDMQVIDFEKQSDFLFKVPNQSNYINLRIDKNNNIAYNFLIEEDKKELSIEKKRRKVIEMESTCDEFQKVLKSLESMGLEINKTKSSDADINKLLQVPKKYREKIRAAAKERERTKERIVKKRYLDK